MRFRNLQEKLEKSFVCVPCIYFREMTDPLQLHILITLQLVSYLYRETSLVFCTIVENFAPLSIRLLENEQVGYYCKLNPQITFKSNLYLTFVAHFVIGALLWYEKYPIWSVTRFFAMWFGYLQYRLQYWRKVSTNLAFCIKPKPK